MLLDHEGIPDRTYLDLLLCGRRQMAALVSMSTCVVKRSLLGLDRLSLTNC